MPSTRRLGGLCVAALLAVAVAGCGTSARFAQFQKFSQAGVTYADTVPAILDEAFELALAVDSLVLTRTRNHLTRPQRIRALSESTKALQERQQVFGEIRRHAVLLRTYFVALGQLAASDADSGIPQATEGLVQSMQGLSGKLKDQTINFGNNIKIPIDKFVGAIATIAVRSYRSAVLTRELRRNAQVIERELAIQEAAIQAVAEGMRDQVQLQINDEMLRQVARPYVNDGSLPSDWNARRLAIFKRNTTIAAADAAAKAAKNLRLSFIALVENRFDLASLNLLISDLNAVVSFVEKYRKPDDKKDKKP